MIHQVHNGMFTTLRWRDSNFSILEEKIRSNKVIELVNFYDVKS